MTVELRTDPPLCPILIRQDGTAIKLLNDPFGEMLAARPQQIKDSAKMPVLEPEKASIPGYMERYERDLKAYNRKIGKIYSVFITGLDETRMIEWWGTINIQEDNFFKGTRFMGIDKSSCSIAARCLKIGMPDTLKVHLGVKFKWTFMDVLNYGLAIRLALEKSGVKQVDVGIKSTRDF